MSTELFSDHTYYKTIIKPDARSIRNLFVFLRTYPTNFIMDNLLKRIYGILADFLCTHTGYVYLLCYLYNLHHIVDTLLEFTSLPFNPFNVLI